MNLFNPKTLWKLVAKILGKIGIFALENLVENNSRGGLFITPQKSARWQSGQKWPSGRPPGRPAQRSYMTVVPPVDRSPPESGVLSVGRLRDRPAELAAMCTSSCTSSCTSVDRARSTGRVGGHVHVLVHIGRPCTVDRPSWRPCARPRAHRSTVLVDQLLVRSTVRSTAEQSGRD